MSKTDTVSPLRQQMIEDMGVTDSLLNPDSLRLRSPALRPRVTAGRGGEPVEERLRAERSSDPRTMIRGFGGA